MSTSLKVVSMAAVFCASFSRSAMRFRSRVILTRSSRPAGRAAGAERRQARRRPACARSAAGCACGQGRDHVALGRRCPWGRWPAPRRGRCPSPPRACARPGRPARHRRRGASACSISRAGALIGEGGPLPSPSACSLASSLTAASRGLAAGLDAADQRADGDVAAGLDQDLGRARRPTAPAPRGSPCRSRARPAARRR